MHQAAAAAEQRQSSLAATSTGGAISGAQPLQQQQQQQQVDHTKIDIVPITCCSKLSATVSKTKDILMYSKSMKFVTSRHIFLIVLIKKRDIRDVFDVYSYGCRS